MEGIAIRQVDAVVLQLSSEEMARYRATVRGREEARRSRAQARQALGQQVAVTAAA
ncbi:MAG: hypothetical protein HC771_23715, partial [Synechococcales cyanobacterium CRU_2_2]|nr:hypothetical protein [Synechococcales cyanobacterium CRU_2_2]